MPDLEICVDAMHHRTQLKKGHTELFTQLKNGHIESLPVANYFILLSAGQINLTFKTLIFDNFT